MVKQPETTPHPDSVVTPPVVDPKMAVNPDQPATEQSGREPPTPSELKPGIPPVPAR